MPLVENANIMSKGIKISKDWSFSKKIFSIAGSSSQAIAEVLPATIIEQIEAYIMSFKNFFV